MRKKRLNEKSLYLDIVNNFFDNDSASKKREEVLLQKMLIDRQVVHLKEAQDINIELALFKSLCI